jgi:hypothetical protein
VRKTYEKEIVTRRESPEKHEKKAQQKTASPK